LNTSRTVRALTLSAAIASAVALTGSGAHAFPTAAKHLRPLPAALVSEIERRNPLLLDQISVVDFNPNVFRTLAKRGVHVIYGDISNVDTLVHAGVRKSELIILSVPDSLLKGASNEKLVRHVRTLNPNAKIIATAELLSDVNDLYAAGADYVTVTRISDAQELFTVIEAASADLLDDKRAEMDLRLSDRREVLP